MSAVDVANKMFMESLRQSFKQVFYKYIRPGSGQDKYWTLHWANEPRVDVIHRLQLLLSWVFGKEAFHLTDHQILKRTVCVYKKYDYERYLFRKYGDIDLD